MVGSGRQGRDLDVLYARLADGSEVPLTAPGDQLDELLADAPVRLRDTEVRGGSRLPRSAESCATRPRDRRGSRADHTRPSVHSLRRYVREAGK